MEEPRLHHCTDFDSFCGILQSRHFRPSFCLEQSNFMDEFQEGAFAVVCFADLLRDEVGRHMKSFKSDSFIVMKKKWAIKNFVCPVVYYSPNTLPASIMKYWSDYCIRRKLSYSHDSVDVMAYKSTYMMFAYMKQYKGSYFDKKKNCFSEEQRVFYLEREWRYVPFVQGGEAYYLSMEDFFDESFRKEKQQELIDHKLSLQFNYDDIEEIGVSFHNLFKLWSILKENPELLRKVRVIGV